MMSAYVRLLGGGSFIALFDQIHLCNHITSAFSMNASFFISEVQACETTNSSDGYNRPCDVQCKLLRRQLKCVENNGHKCRYGHTKQKESKRLEEPWFGSKFSNFSL